ncbi:MAG: DUF2550 domain-containing protein [Gordonia sp. (in: high G+C Gram-positive bacteria)]
MPVVVVVLTVVLVVLLALIGYLLFRVRLLRRRGTPVLMRAMPAEVDTGWRHGTVHYSDSAVRYYRLSSLRIGPTYTLPRRAIDITGRRRPIQTETEILEGMLVVGVHQKPGPGRIEADYEIAFGPGGVTAFQSWLEARRSARARRH